MDSAGGRLAARRGALEAVHAGAMAGRIESAPAAERYFCTLSPLCKRIISNVQTIRSLHADDWQDLTYADQCDVIDGHMVNQETVDHWRRLSRQPGDGAPSIATIPAGPKIVEDEDPETGQVVRWRDEHAAPFSWRTPSQERLAAGGDPADSPVRQQPFMMRDSIRQRLSKVEHMYESYSPKRTVNDGFDSPSLVLGGSSGDAGSPAGRSLKQQVLSRLAHGRRVLLSITRLGKQPAAPPPPRRLEISPPCSDLPPAALVAGVPRPRLQLAPEPAAGAGAGAAVESPASSDSSRASRGSRGSVSSPGAAVSKSASFRRLTKPSTPPPPPPVQAALVPIRTSAAHAPSVRSSSQYAAPTAPPSPPPPTAGARAQPTPPQLKRVLPPVVPRRDSLTPDRETGARPPGDGSELAPPAEEERDLRLARKPTPPRRAQPQPETKPEPEPELREPDLPEPPEPEPPEPKSDPEPEPVYEHSYQHSYEPEMKLVYEEKQPQLEPEPFQSVLEEPTKVDIKTGFDFLDNW